jgi:hypothetical protein
MTTDTPRWVKAFALTAGVLVLAFIVLHLTGNSPGHHGSASGVTDHGP